MQVKVGQVSSPTANVSQILQKVAENDKVSVQLFSVAQDTEHY